MDELQGLIAREVRIRFELDAAGFAVRVQALGETQVARLALDDLYLATACVRNEERAWQELSARHFDFMREFARRFLPAAAARDLADEVIADLWERGRMRQYEGRSSLRTWLATVVAHAALNSRKAKARFVPFDAGEARARDPESARDESTAPADAQAAGLLREMLHSAVRDLSPEDRVLLQLYYEQGLTLDQLGVTLCASSAAISRRLKHAREEVRAAIDTLARQRTGGPADELRVGLDLGRIEFDLARLFGGESAATGERHESV